MNMGNDSKLITWDETADELLAERHELWQRMADGDTAVLAHLRAALKALDEHDCALVAKEIREAMELL